MRTHQSLCLLADWYPWGVFFKDNTLSQFKEAFRRVVGILKKTGANFK
jgi:hypothetical protein